MISYILFFVATEFTSAVDLPGFEQYKEVPLGFTVRGIEMPANKPFTRDYYFYEYKNYLEYRQDISNVEINRKKKESYFRSPLN